MREIDEGEGKSPGNKSVIFGIKLTFDPVGPDPIQVMLDDTVVDKTPGMQHHACAQQFDRLVNLGGLGESTETRQQGDRIKKPVSPGNAANDKFPGKPF